MNWRDNPKRVRAVELIEEAHEHERMARWAHRKLAEHLHSAAANCRAQSRRLAAEADKVAA